MLIKNLFSFDCFLKTIEGGNMKSVIKGIVWGLIAVLILSTSAWAFGRKKVIKIGINAPITGDIPKVGEGTKFAALMWLAQAAWAKVDLGCRWKTPSSPATSGPRISAG